MGNIKETERNGLYINPLKKLKILIIHTSDTELKKHAEDLHIGYLRDVCMNKSLSK